MRSPERTTALYCVRLFSGRVGDIKAQAMLVLVLGAKYQAG
ncbi:hypothetical protein [Vibrio sp. CAU 1672]|nr:hypothetical protein [Vibrio sp. CAU 1672]MDF2155855.1 hypothetical protein [Vibrio sp. CAU 1672]